MNMPPPKDCRRKRHGGGVSIEEMGLMDWPVSQCPVANECPKLQGAARGADAAVLGLSAAVEPCVWDDSL
jgi:hypothetical protein